MQMNTRDIYKHIHTMHLQNEVSKFLSDCESLDTKPESILTSMEVIDGKYILCYKIMVVFPNTIQLTDQ